MHTLRNYLIFPATSFLFFLFFFIVLSHPDTVTALYTLLPHSSYQYFHFQPVFHFPLFLSHSVFFPHLMIRRACMAAESIIQYC